MLGAGWRTRRNGRGNMGGMGDTGGSADTCSTSQVGATGDVAGTAGSDGAWFCTLMAGAGVVEGPNYAQYENSGPCCIEDSSADQVVSVALVHSITSFHQRTQRTSQANTSHRCPYTLSRNPNMHCMTTAFF